MGLFNFECADDCGCYEQFDWTSAVAVKLPPGVHAPSGEHVYVRGEYNGYGRVYFRVVPDDGDDVTDHTIGEYDATGRLVRPVGRPEIGTIELPVFDGDDYKDGRPEVEACCFGRFSIVAAMIEARDSAFPKAPESLQASRSRYNTNAPHHFVDLIAENMLPYTAPRTLDIRQAARCFIILIAHAVPPPPPPTPPRTHTRAHPFFTNIKH